MIWLLLSLVFALAGLWWLGSISVQSLRQARLLGSLPRGIVAGLEGQQLTVRGKVKVLEPLVVTGIGACLWCRRTEKEMESMALGLAFGGRRRWHTISDQRAMAKFTLLVSGE